MATFTLTVPSEFDARILAAIGIRLNLKDESNNPRSATGPEAKQFLIDYLKLTVREVEQFVARTTANAGVTDITVT